MNPSLDGFGDGGGRGEARRATSGFPAPLRMRALGTTAVVAVTDRSAREEARALLVDELDAIDHACSRFRDDSEIATVNRAHGAAVPVSQLFLEATEVALRAARLTDGRVDPTVGSAMRVLGYDRDFADVAASGEPLRVHVVQAPGWRSVHVDPDARTVRVPPGVALDFGATAKALAADRAAARIAYVTGAGVLVSLGGDCSVAGPAPTGGWPVHIADRHDAPVDGPGPTVLIEHGGLATSGTAARRWSRGGRSLHHVVDPRTGWPAEEVWRTVTVAGASCVDANVASTAAIVTGAAAPAWLEAHGLAARLVGVDGAVVTTGGWPAPRSSADA